MPTEQELLAELDHYRYMVEFNPQIPWTAAPDGNITDFNQRWLELPGLTREQALGGGWAQVQHPDDLPLVVEAWTQAIAMGEPYDIEHRIRTAGGEYRWMRSRATPRRDERGCILRWYGYTEDIHERHLAQDTLRERETRLRRIMDANAVGLAFGDDSGRITDVNDAYARMTGYTREELLSGTKDWLSMTPPEFEEITNRAVQQMRETGIGPTIEKEILRKDGGRTPVLVTGALVDKSGGEHFTFVVDLTERRRAQAAARTAEAQVRAITDALPVLISYVDKDGYYRYASRAYEDWFGIPSDQLCGRTVRDVIGEAACEVVQPYMDAVLSGQKVAFDSRMPYRFGGTRHIHVEYVPDLRQDGRVAGFFAAVEDISERVRQREEIEALNEQLQRAIQETHHRVKNNLQVMSALAEIQSSEGPMVSSSALHRIGQHARALALIHDILTRQAQQGDGIETISTDEAFSRLIPLLSATTGGRRLTYACDNFRLTVKDGASLTLLVSELVSNAVKHGRGDIEVTLTTNGEEVRMEVCDDGSGFPESFDPRCAANTGLDLILTAARHDLRGDIRFDTRPEGGARVAVMFPVARSGS